MGGCAAASGGQIDFERLGDPGRRDDAATDLLVVDVPYLFRS